jgi:hypothetical protein
VAPEKLRETLGTITSDYKIPYYYVYNSAHLVALQVLRVAVESPKHTAHGEQGKHLQKFDLCSMVGFLRLPIRASIMSGGGSGCGYFLSLQLLRAEERCGSVRERELVYFRAKNLREGT